MPSRVSLAPRDFGSGSTFCALAVSYGSGSGQQSVTGYKDTSDAASLWTVKGAKVHNPNPSICHNALYGDLAMPRSHACCKGKGKAYTCLQLTKLSDSLRLVEVAGLGKIPVSAGGGL